MQKKIFSLIFIFLSSVCFSNDHFVMLIHHHIGDDFPASTSLSVNDFRKQLDYLKANHQVIKLSDALTQPSLPENAVVISFDDASSSLYSRGHAILQEYGFPYTIFVNTDAVDSGYRSSMTWQQMRELKADGVEFGNHSELHEHMTEQSVQASIQSIRHAQTRLYEELGITNRWLAYPYGEWSLALHTKVRQMGFTAFGQHSGAIARQQQNIPYPRFPAAGIYAQISSLKVKLASQPLPISYLSNSDMVYDGQSELTLALAEGPFRRQQLSCFYNNRPMDIDWIDEKSFRIGGDLDTLPKGRSRFNCTAPHNSGKFYYWFSHAWLNEGT